MKCPTCGYLGFEALDRCRNCGYDFAFSAAPEAADLRLRPDEPEIERPLDDLALVDRAARVPGGDGRRDAGAAADRGGRSTRGREPTPDLPLFGAEAADDAPLITRPSPPRHPLSVRRAAGEVPRVRADPRASPSITAPMLDLEPGLDLPSTGVTAVNHRRGGGGARTGGVPDAPETAALGARVLAVIIDLLMLAVIDLVVIYFTMQICGLTIDDLGILPKGPLIAFFLVQNGGYLVAFTAGGQTLGKMAAGIRVVSTSPGGSVDLGRSVVRTLVWALLAIPAGLGFLTALFSPDRRGLHDRCAGTRVVRAAA